MLPCGDSLVHPQSPSVSLGWFAARGGGRYPPSAGAIGGLGMVTLTTVRQSESDVGRVADENH